MCCHPAVHEYMSLGCREGNEEANTKRKQSHLEESHEEGAMPPTFLDRKLELCLEGGGSFKAVAQSRGSGQVAALQRLHVMFWKFEYGLPHPSKGAMLVLSKGKTKRDE